MITINDDDMPITVAEKIINGTFVVKLSPEQKALREILIGSEDDYGNHDMFELEEIKEIADYLMIYYNSHSQGEQKEMEE